MNNDRDLAKHLHDAFRVTRALANEKNIPAFDDLPSEHQAVWVAVAKAAREKLAPGKAGKQD